MGNDAPARQLIKISLEEVPRDAEQRVKIDLFVHLPTAGKFLRFLPAGEQLSERKLLALQRHVVPEVYVDEIEYNKTKQVRRDEAPPAPKVEKEPEPPKAAVPSTAQDAGRGDIISNEVKQELKEVYSVLLSADDGEVDASTKEKLVFLADKVVQAVAPEVDNFKETIMQNTKYLHLMTDASAITTLAIMFALANGFDSRKSYQDISYACILMDLGMTEMPKEDIEAHYKGRFNEPYAAISDSMRKHPAKSHTLAQTKLKNVTDGTLQLILNHHEIFNGKGYPRGIRNETLFPLARILAFAVDVFEIIKGGELQGTNVTVEEAITKLNPPASEGHMRRHNRDLMKKSLDFVMTSSARPEAAPSA